ncbi:MAG: arsenic resistance protein [Euryarchaeota archaeon]|nr:arsenic resistance protein [Euryarchaeota archaeon]
MTGGERGKGGEGIFRPPVHHAVIAVGIDLERHQIIVYAVAVGAAMAAALVRPEVAARLEPLINPVLAVLLYATFLLVPFVHLRRSLGNRRFLAASLVVNFLVVPFVAFGLVRLLVNDPVLAVGAIMVLVTPCIDYVVTFTRLAGGDAGQVAATTPLLMLLQLLLLPVYLWFFVGASVAGIVEPRPLLEAFVLIIALPLFLAWGTEALAERRKSVQRWQTIVGGLSVPLVALTLFVIIASQLPRVQGSVVRLLPVVGVYAVFLIVIPPLAWATAVRLNMAPHERTALVFTSVTRNSLVVLPLALALPAAYLLVPAVVVTQTLVELIGMVVLTAVMARVGRD